MDVLDAALALAGGLAAGIAAGLFGIGGGLVMVPVLHYGMGLAWSDAVATSLLVITLNTPVGLWAQSRRGNLLWGTGILLAAGGLIGVVAADRAFPHLPVPVLKLLFAALMALAAWRVARPGPASSSPRRAPVWLLLPAGIAAGFAARLLGIGGGLLMVPVMVLSGIPIHLAVATSLIAVETNALLSTLVNLAALPSRLLTAAVFALGAIPGIRLGVRLANALTAGRLSWIYATALLLAAAAITYDGATSLR